MYKRQSRKTRRVYVTEDTLIPATGQAEVGVRIKHRTLQDKPYLGVVENNEVPMLAQVFNARSLIPAQFSDIRIPFLNVGKQSRIVPKGTEIGILQEAESVEEITEFPPRTARIKTETLSADESEVIEKMVKNLPDELTDEQLSQVRDVLIRNRNILSTGEYLSLIHI